MKVAPNMYTRLLAVTLLLLLPQVILSQETWMKWEEFVTELTDQEDAEELGWAEHIEELAELHANPIDVNAATAQELRQIAFLTEEQVEGIVEYVFRHGGMRSLAELVGVESIDYATRRYLSLFLYTGLMDEPKRDTLATFRHFGRTMGTLFKHSRHDFSSRLDLPLYYRKGYCVTPSEGGYWGAPVAHRMQYRLTSLHHLQVALQAKKDAGEPFRGNGGWDSYGGHIALTDMGRLQMLVVGDFRANFGEGLVMNQGLVIGKQQLATTASGLRGRTGYDEFRYLRGVAASFSLPRELTVSAFASLRQYDATLNTDGTVATLLTANLHRTTTERMKKNNQRAALFGGHLAWRHHWRDNVVQLGMTGYWQHTSRRFQPGTALYRRFYPQGRDFGVAGVHYSYSGHWFSLHGETAYSTNHGGWAMHHRAVVPIVGEWKASVVQRYYGQRYYSFHAAALCDNTQVQNETGVLLRIDGRPAAGLTVAAYADFFYNPWPRYGLTHSTAGQELVGQGTYELSRHSSIAVRYQWKRKEYSQGMLATNRLRLTFQQDVGTHWQLQSVGQLSASQRLAGWGLSQRVKYTHRLWHAQCAATWFLTPDYQHRLYFYEPSVAASFYQPALFGHGLRAALMVGCSLWKRRVRLEVKGGSQYYFDRKLQGSGMQAISSPWKSDVQVLLRMNV